MTVVSPCEGRDWKGRRAVKTDASTLPTDASTISSRHAYCEEIASTRGFTGTITQYSPGSAIVLKETSGPVHYHFGKTVTYVSRSGKVHDEKTVKARIKVGVPVRVHYAGTGEHKVVDRVILEQD